MLTLDGKGRITVPARWLDLLLTNVQGHLVVAKNPDGCLSLFPLPVWEQFQDRLLGLPMEFDPWRRLFMGSATDVDIDSGSRVLIPPELRAWAGLEKDVKFMGVGANFELWDTARYSAAEQQALDGPRPEFVHSVVMR